MPTKQPPSNPDPQGDPTFSAASWRQLRGLGLTDADVEALQWELPVCRTLLAPEPPTNAIRTELSNLEARLKSSVDAITSVLAADAASRPALRFVQDLLHVRETHVLEQAQQATLRALAAVQAAARRAPAGQRYRQEAVYEPVRRLHAVMPAAIRPSTQDSSPFRQIVGICYEAVGHSESSEAIKKYVKRWREESQQAG